MKNLFKKGIVLFSSTLLMAACTTNTEKETNNEPEEPTTENNETIEEEKTTFQYEINPDTWQIVPMEDSDASNDVVLLTFDDAPDQYALEIAKKLDRLDAPAIFFVNGMYLDNAEGEDMLKEIHKLGFEIGNHSYTHPDLTTLSYEEQLDEIKSVNDRVEEIIGVRPRFIRPPFGLFDENTIKAIEQEQMTLMNWTYGYDWEEEYQNGDALADIMVNTEFLSPGSNLLMHDRSWTLDAQEGIVSGLREKGYEFVDPAQLISARDSNE